MRKAFRATSAGTSYGLILWIDLTSGTPYMMSFSSLPRSHHVRETEKTEMMRSM